MKQIMYNSLRDRIADYVNSLHNELATNIILNISLFVLQEISELGKDTPNISWHSLMNLMLIISIKASCAIQQKLYA